MLQSSISEDGEPFYWALGGATRVEDDHLVLNHPISFIDFCCVVHISSMLMCKLDLGILVGSRERQSKSEHPSVRANLYYIIVVVLELSTVLMC